MNSLAYHVLFALSVIIPSFSFGVFAQSGFEDPAVISLLEMGNRKTGIHVESIIAAAQNAIGEGDMIRYMISDEGELFFLDDNGQLFAVVTIQRLGEIDPSVIICQSDIDALTKRASGIAYETDDISAEDARSNNFEFLPADDSSESMTAFIAEYTEMHPELAQAQREQQDLYKDRKPACNKRATKRHKTQAQPAPDAFRIRALVDAFNSK